MRNKTIESIINMKSDTIKAVTYHNKTLLVKFVTGSIYQYLNVPRMVFSRLNYAESKGKFFSREIRGNFDYIKIA